MKKREVICKDCGEKWNISRQQDTSGGYLCPRCTSKRRKERGQRGGQNELVVQQEML